MPSSCAALETGASAISGRNNALGEKIPPRDENKFPFHPRCRNNYFIVLSAAHENAHDTDNFFVKLNKAQ
jgi:hypothetical protein